MLKKIPSVLLVCIKTEYTESFSLEVTFKGDLVQHSAVYNLSGQCVLVFHHAHKETTSSFYLSLNPSFSLKPLTLM